MEVMSTFYHGVSSARKRICHLIKILTLYEVRTKYETYFGMTDAGPEQNLAGIALMG